MKNIKRQSILALAVCGALGLSGCNLDINVSVDEETRKDINKTTTGVITALGKLEVNGVTYDTSNVDVTADGENASENDLKIGMVVTVTGTESSDGNSGKAYSINYDDIVEGTVIENNILLDSTLNIMGQTIHVDENTVFESKESSVTQLSEINVNNMVEVSGYTSGTGEIWATRIEVKNIYRSNNDEMEVKGVINQLTDTSFQLGELTINYTAQTDIDNNGEWLRNGLYVEVSSQSDLSPLGEFNAHNIKLKGNGDINIHHSENDDEVELKGRITSIVDDKTIEVNGVEVQLTDSTHFDDGDRSQLTLGVIIEVEGYIDTSGNFRATEIDFENDRDNDRDDDRDSDRNDDRDDNRDDDRDDDRNDDRDDDRDDD